MPSLEAVADHLEITQVLERYFRAMDDKDYALLDGVFVPGAKLVYDMGSGAAPRSTHPEIVEQFRSFNEQFRFTQHVTSQPLIDLDGDSARSRATLRALHVQETESGERNTWIVYGVYEDRLRRTQAGWRIVERRFEARHVNGRLLPADRVKRFPRPVRDL